MEGKTRGHQAKPKTISQDSKAREKRLPRSVVALMVSMTLFISAFFVTSAPAHSLAAEAPDDSVAIYCLYNQWSDDVIYTLDENEYKALQSIGWTGQRVAWYAPKASSTPVLRLYSNLSGVHIFTANKSEYDELAQKGWSQEGTAFYSDDSHTVPVYCFGVGVKYGDLRATYYYSAVKNDYDRYRAVGMDDGGIAFYGVADGDKTPLPLDTPGDTTIIFDANGGHFGTDSAATSKNTNWRYYSSAQYISFPEGVSRNGYVLRGWAKSPDAEPSQIVLANEGDTDSYALFKANSADRLYAVWSLSATVTFDANGGSFADGSATQSISNITDPQLDAKVDAPSKEYSNFLGWALTPDAGEDDVVYGSGKSYTITGDVTLYAVWSTPATVTFDANGGSFSDGGSEQFFYATTNSQLDVKVDAPSKEYSNFLGWALTPDAGEDDIVYGSEKSYEVTGDVTLYAVWSTPATVTFDADGGLFADGSSTRSVYTAVDSPLNATVDVPSKDYSNFLGWALVPDAGEDDVVYGSGKSYIVTGDVTIYAVWSHPATVTFDANGGSFADRTATQSISALVNSPLAANVDAPSKEYSNFLGWALTPNASEKDIAYGSGKSYEVTGDVTFYAIWSPPATVTFNANGGSFGNGDVTQSVLAKRNSVLNVSVVTPTKEGSSFLGWALAPNASEDDVVYSSNRSYSVTGDVTLYAVWKEDPVPDPEPDPYDEIIPVYRLYNQWSGEHLYTADAEEYQNLADIGWNKEGVAWKSPAMGGLPIWRLYNPYSGDHLYTNNYAEFLSLTAIGWQDDGFTFFDVGEESVGAIPVYRLFNQWLEVGNHLLTTNKPEYDSLQILGWKGEDIAFYGWAE